MVIGTGDDRKRESWVRSGFGVKVRVRGWCPIILGDQSIREFMKGESGAGEGGMEGGEREGGRGGGGWEGEG